MKKRKDAKTVQLRWQQPSELFLALAKGGAMTHLTCFDVADYLLLKIDDEALRVYLGTNCPLIAVMTRVELLRWRFLMTGRSKAV